jgi:hypothetical protein
VPPVGHTVPLLSKGEAHPWLRITDNSVSVYNHTGLDKYFNRNIYRGSAKNYAEN